MLRHCTVHSWQLHKEFESQVCTTDTFPLTGMDIHPPVLPDARNIVGHPTRNLPCHTHALPAGYRVAHKRLCIARLVAPVAQHGETHAMQFQPISEWRARLQMPWALHVFTCLADVRLREHAAWSRLDCYCFAAHPAQAESIAFT